MRKKIRQIKDLYWKYERHISSVSLLAGFIFDSVALKRVDLFIENFWIVVHLLMAAIGLIALNLYEDRHPNQKEFTVARFWLIVLVQFAFGGLYSTFLVFYFRSATLSTSWPFLLILAVNLVANEALKYRYSRFSFQVSMLFISIYSFMIFFVPVVLHRLGAWIFLLSGLLSLIILSLYISLLKWLNRDRFHAHRWLVRGSVGAIFILINILYFTNLIPPIPLALKDGGVYRSLTHTPNGSYIVQAEKHGWLDFFRSYEPLHAPAGASVYAFSAVFSPPLLNTTIVHEWQYFDQTTGRWLTMARSTLPIIGGRDSGFRTYSSRTGLTPGLWRVNVETERGQVIGRIKFRFIPTTTKPNLVNLSL